MHKEDFENSLEKLLIENPFLQGKKGNESVERIIRRYTFVGSLCWEKLIHQMTGFVIGYNRSLASTSDPEDAAKDITRLFFIVYKNAERWSRTQAELQEQATQEFDMFDYDWHEGHPSNYGDR